MVRGSIEGVVTTAHLVVEEEAQRDDCQDTQQDHPSAPDHPHSLLELLDGQFCDVNELHEYLLIKFIGVDEHEEYKNRLHFSGRLKRRIRCGMLTDDVGDYFLEDEFFLVVLEFGLAEVDVDGLGDDHVATNVGLTGIKGCYESVFVVDHDFLDGIFGRAPVECVFFEGIVRESDI